MTPTPWAQAVEAFKTYAPCCECGMCVSDGLRAALPHLMRAVVGGITGNPECVALDGAAGRHVMVPRAALLSALTAAAGRVDAVTPDPHIGPC